MRHIPEDFHDHLRSGATTVCNCWKILRNDGVALGFTDHDNNLSFDTVEFEAASGLSGSALQGSSGLAVDNSEAIGALSADAITEADIAAGLFDHAEVWHWSVNWRDVDQRIFLFRGALGEIRRDGTNFSSELRSLTDALNRSIGRSFMRQCGAELGDGSCGVDLQSAEYTETAEVVAVNSRKQFTISGALADANWYQHGTLSWTSGDMAGQSAAIFADADQGDTRQINLVTDAPKDIVVGDTLTLIAGCDKQVQTCKAKFANIANFQGFPHIPGEDWAIAYPVRGEALDGGSLVNKNG